ncbi:MAG: hypothetical protein EBS42_04775 [Caulobacteraceae bacterium]|jgi:hypothetical protein|nr:hypothetical protein [Caulobacteraceae bacterium]
MTWPLRPGETETLVALVILVAIMLPILVLGAVITPTGCLGRVGREALARPFSREGLGQALELCRRNQRGMSADKEAAESGR